MVVSRNVAGLDLKDGGEGGVLGVGSVEEGLGRLREMYLGEEGESRREQQQQGGDGYVGGERGEEGEREREVLQLGRVFVIGGAEIYKHVLGMKCCERILWTRLRGEWGCDVFFPEGVLQAGNEGEDARVEDVGGQEKKGKWVRRSVEEMERWVGEEGVGGVKKEGEVEFEVCMLEREGASESE